MATGTAVTPIVTTAVVVAAMAAADATTAKATMQSRSPFHSRWLGPDRTGATNGPVVVMAKVVAAISSQPMPHRKMRHRSNSLRQVRNHRHGNVKSGKPRDQEAMALVIAKLQAGLKISPSYFRENGNESISDRRPCRVHVPFTRSACSG